MERGDRSLHQQPGTSQSHTGTNHPPVILQQSIAAALTACWSATLTHAAMTPFAATLLGETTPNLYDIDTNPPNWSQLLAEAAPDPHSSSRLPPPSYASLGSGLFLSCPSCQSSACRLASKAVGATNRSGKRKG